MTRAGLSALAVLALAAACSRAPRSAAYFAAHPAETDRTLAACAAWTVRGDDCAHAEQGRAARDSARRLARYRQGFAR